MQTNGSDRKAQILVFKVSVTYFCTKYKMAIPTTPTAIPTTAEFVAAKGPVELSGGGGVEVSNNLDTSVQSWEVRN